MATKPGEKVVLTFEEEPMWGLPRYEIVHLNKEIPKVLHSSGKRTSEDRVITSYWMGQDRPQGYFIGKQRSDSLSVSSDVLVVRKGGGGQIEEKLYKFALKYTRKYTKEKGLKFEDQTNFQQDPQKNP